MKKKTNAKAKAKPARGGIRSVRWLEHKDLVSIAIVTRVPDKWLFIDRETGDVWRWDAAHGFKRA